jgi:phage anti-repressor protein
LLSGIENKGRKIVDLNQSLITISNLKIGGKTIASIDARELHAALGVKKDFSDWAKQYIESKHSDWIENRDFAILLPQKGESQWGGNNRIDYAFSIEMAEHIAMMTRTQKGKEVRQYFRKARDERDALKEADTAPQVQDPALQLLLQNIQQTQSLVIALDQARQEIKAANEKANLALWMQTRQTVRHFVWLHGLTRQLPEGKLQNAYGRYLAGYCLEQGIPVYKVTPADRVWTTENEYPVSVIDATIHEWLRGQTRQLSAFKAR